MPYANNGSIGGTKGREWKNHKYTSRHRNKYGKWVYDTNGSDNGGSSGNVSNSSNVVVGRIAKSRGSSSIRTVSKGSIEVIGKKSNKFKTGSSKGDNANEVPAIEEKVKKLGSNSKQVSNKNSDIIPAEEETDSIESVSKRKKNKKIKADNGLITERVKADNASTAVKKKKVKADNASTKVKKKKFVATVSKGSGYIQSMLKTSKPRISYMKK